MIETKDLTLTVERQVPGELVTNALAIEAFVSERIKDFTPEKYYDDPEQAKKDRAILNAAAKDLNSRRLSLEREFNAPFEPVKSAIKRATDILSAGADKLGEVWNAVEETIKAEKRREIEQAWTATAFDLFPLDKIFDQRWLNRGFKLSEIKEEIVAKITKTYGDLKIIEAIGQDSETVKAFYLETLDIGAALAKGQALKANRDRLAQEASARAEREAATVKAEAVAEFQAEAVAELQADKVSPLAAAALDEEAEYDPLITEDRRCIGTRDQLLRLHKAAVEIGVKYERIEAPKICF